MAGGRWRDAREAVKQIAPKVVEADPDGVTLFFFSDGKPVKYVSNRLLPCNTLFPYQDAFACIVFFFFLQIFTTL